jgi:deoxycytidylate deaminase
MSKKKNFILAAIDEASKSPLRYQLGAVLVRGGKIYSRGYNQDKHAECACVSRVTKLCHNKSCYEQV